MKQLIEITAGDSAALQALSLFRQAAMVATSVVALTATSAYAQDAEQDQGGIQEIIVTAQKRAENVNSVPMSITAASGDELVRRGVTETRDLGKITPGFNYSESSSSTPIYSLRGIGYGDISLGGRPTVSVYVDEAPLPFAIETRGTALDLERVEVLKGPQGTLFGQNATGGAINFIAAKPTSSLAAGVDVSYGRFSQLDFGGFVSGPVSDTLKARVAFQHKGSGDWQESFTRKDSRGREDFTNGRLLLDWTPTDTFRAQLNVNGWRDRSDTQSPQLIAIVPVVPSVASLVPGLLATPLAPANARATDWNPGEDFDRNNKFLQTNLRLDFDVSDSVTLTSLTSYSNWDGDEFYNLDGSAQQNLDFQRFGDIETYFQEFRISADLSGRGNLVAGASYEHDVTHESDFLNLSDATQGYFVTPLGLPRFRTLNNVNDQRARTLAAFASVDYEITPTLTISGGARYTDFKDKFVGCSFDAGDGNIASVFTPLYNFIRAGGGLGPITPILPGGCATLNDSLVPEVVRTTLKEDNLSWRANIQWKPSVGTLLYANVSKGYKAGSFPIGGATRSTSLRPAGQESVLAYETGFKISALDRKLQLNGALFYYDYRDKQIQGRVLDPFIGGLFRLLNIPESEVKGAELQVVWAPIQGLTTSMGASYVDSKIKGNYSNFDVFSVPTNFQGQPFPNTPKWQFASDIDYKWSLNDRFDAFVGGGVTHQSANNSALGQQPLLSVKAYTLIDLRAGFETSDGRWRATAWGRNVGNEYYWVATTYIGDGVARVAGRPATYGVSLAYRFK
jgi:iron complex outermembrane recepter protein